MRFQVRRDIHHERAAGAVTHRAVVNAIPVDGRADADVVDVRRQNDEFILESRIGTGKLGDDDGGFERLREYNCIRVERNGQRKVRKRPASCAEGGEFSDILFRNLQAEANKNQSRGKRYRSLRGASADEGIVGKRKWLRLAVGDESKRGLGFIDFELVEPHRLVEAVRARRLEAGFLELLDGVSLGFA